MLTMKKLTLMGAAGALSALLLSPMAHAWTYSDAGAAIVVWPKIEVNANRDTVLTITNMRNAPVTAHCFYVNANSRCTNTGEVCETSATCFDTSTGFFGSCTAGWIEVNFDIVLTPLQPLSWSAEEGMANADLPCPGGLLNTCPGSNAGTRIPPVGEATFVGELKCIETDPVTRLPDSCSTNDCETSPTTCCRNDLRGSAMITTVTGAGATAEVDVERYNAVGLRTAGFNNADPTLVIGPNGPTAAEYEPCPEVLVFNHLFDNAIDPISGIYEAHTELALVPCTQNFLIQRVPQVTAQFLVYNEFEQRFSTSRSVDCLLNTPISEIDTSQSNRSIFNAGVSGTVAGNTRITGVNGGLIGAATLQFCSPLGCTTQGTGPAATPGGAGFNLHQFDERDDADIITIP